MKVGGRVVKRAYHRFLVLVIAAALAASGGLAWHRVQVESEFRQVEIAVIFDEAQLLSGYTYRDTVKTLERLREYGVTAVFFREPTLAQAAEDGWFTVLSVSELQKEPWFAATGVSPPPDYLYLVTRDPEMYAHLYRQMRMKVGSLTGFVFPEEERYVLALPVPAAYLGVFGAGFPAQDVAQITAAGLNVIPQVRTWPGVTARGLAGLAQTLGEIDGISAVAFNDPYLPGYPGLLPVLARELAPLDVPVTDIEFYHQAGLRGLARQLPARQVMLHAIPAHEMPRYTPASAADRMVLAAVERNARVLLVRFFFDAQNAEDVWTVNTDYLREISTRLEAAGFTLGAPTAPAPWLPPRGLVALIGLGVIAGGLLLWERLRLPFGPAAGVLAVLAWGGVLWVLELNLAAKLAALAGVIIFPILAVVTVVREQGAPVGRSLLLFLQAVAISLVGAAFLVGLLSDTGFMIKLDQFAGVKLAHALPLLAVVFYFAFRPRGEKGWLDRFRGFLGQPVLVIYALLGAAAAAAAAVYLLRTGNEPAVLVSSFEMQMRAALDQALAVRPRTKEFLLGHPWLLLLLFTGYRDARYLPLVALGVIGQISLVNTFAHLHTPLFISAFRAFNGLWLGIALGLVLIAVWYAVERRRAPKPVGGAKTGSWACIPEETLRSRGGGRRTGPERPGE